MYIYTYVKSNRNDGAEAAHQPPIWCSGSSSSHTSSSPEECFLSSTPVSQLYPANLS